MNVFISYSHNEKDEPYLKEFLIRMKLLKNKKLVSNYWVDKQILPGTKWDEEIKEQLNKADIIVFLVSDNFISSDYINNIEIQSAIQRYNNNEVCLIPIVIRDCNKDFLEITEFQGLPKGLLPVSLWDDEDSAWVNITEGLKDTIIKIKEKKSETASVDEGNSVSTSAQSQTIRESQEFENKQNQPIFSTGSYLLQFEQIKEKLSDDFKAKNEYFDNQFTSIAQKEKLNPELLGIITQVRLDDGEIYTYAQKCQVVGALTLSLLDKYDRSKVLLLIDFIEDKEALVWKRAMAGMIFGIAGRENEIDDWVEKRLQVFKNDMEFNQAFTELFYIVNHYESKGDANLFIKKNYEKMAFFDNNGNWFLPYYKDNPYQKLNIKKSDIAEQIYNSILLGDDCSKYAASIQFKELTKEHRKQFLSELSHEENFVNKWITYESEREEQLEKKLLPNYISLLLTYFVQKTEHDWKQLLKKIIEAQDVFEIFLAQPFNIKIEAIRNNFEKKPIVAIEKYIAYLHAVDYNDSSALRYLADCYYLNIIDDAKALHYYQKSYTLDPLDGYVNMMIGFLKQTLGGPGNDNFLEYYENCHALDPANTWNLARLGHCYQQTDPPQFEKALEYQLKSYRIDSSDYWNTANIGFSYQKINVPDHDEALRYHQEAYDLKPDYTWNTRMLGYCYQICSTPNFDKALELHLLAHAEEPENVWNLKNIAYCYKNISKPDYKKSLDYLYKAEKLEPNDQWTMTNIGDCLLKKPEPDYAAAKSYFEKVQDFNPDDEYNTLLLAKSLIALADFNNAAELLQQIIDKKTLYVGDSMLLMGHMFAAQHNMKEAQNYYQQYAALNYWDKNMLKNKAYDDWKILEMHNVQKDALDRVIVEAGS